MNILYLSDPNSIHDIKWMTFFTKAHNCFLLMRKHHAQILGEDKKAAFEPTHCIKLVGELEDFSIRHWRRTSQQVKLLKNIIQQYNIQVLHIMYAEPNALWAYFRKQLGIPIVLTTRGTDVLKTIPHFFEKKTLINRIIAYFYKQAFRKVDALTSTSLRQKEAVKRLCGNLPPIAEIIRTGVDIDKILSNTSSHRLGALNHKKYIFFPRAMRPLYNHELALAAIKLLPKEFLEQYYFVFVDKNSSDKAYTEKVQGLMDSSAANFVWLENLDQLTLFQTYKDAALVVMTPLSDGTPVSGIETMLCRVPILLPPLKYDADLFTEGVVYTMTWHEADLSKRMQQILQGFFPVDTEIAYKNALALADRNKEMTKLGHIYNDLCN